MCLTNIWSKEKQDKWLKKQRTTIRAYKVVYISGDGHPLPLYYARPNEEPFSKVNDQRNYTPSICYAYSPDEYRSIPYEAHFHLFLHKTDATEWAQYTPLENCCVLRCSIPKADITEIGIQDGFTVIVTKCFKFVEKTKLLKEQPR
jgi:hypothetical protein